MFPPIWELVHPFLYRLVLGCTSCPGGRPLPAFGPYPPWASLVAAQLPVVGSDRSDFLAHALPRPTRYGLRRPFVVGSPSEFVVGGDSLQNPSGFQATSAACADKDSGRLILAIGNEVFVSSPSGPGHNRSRGFVQSRDVRAPKSGGFSMIPGKRLLLSLSVLLQPRQLLPGILLKWRPDEAPNFGIVGKQGFKGL